MIRQISTKVVPLTLELAEEFMTMPSWSGERPLRAKQVEMLLDKINKGLFHSPTWAQATLCGRVYRMNGQHSANALYCCHYIPRGLNATILEFSVDSDRDLADLFAQFDNPDSARKMNEIVHAQKCTNDVLMKYPSSKLRLITSSILFADPHIIDSKYRDDQSKMIHDNVSFIEFVDRHAKAGKLLYKAIIAAMYLTWRTDDVAAEKFWALVYTESHVNANDGTRVLARFISQEVAIKNGRRWDTRAVMVKCLHGWNAHWRQETTTLRYSADASIPDVI